MKINEITSDINCILGDASVIGSKPSSATTSQAIASLSSAVYRYSPTALPYIKQVDWIILHKEVAGEDTTIQNLIGILQALRSDYVQGRIRTFYELVHADTFADFLESAEYLLAEGYKDASAMMIGGVLEQHLRELCRKHGVDTTFINNKGDTKQKMLDALNADLAKVSAYGKIEQKQVTSWTAIRNAAAHGNYNDYDNNQVKQMITSVRDFISKYPA